MRQQHIHSANGDKEVLPEARGTGDRQEDGRGTDGMARAADRRVKTQRE